MKLGTHDFFEVLNQTIQALLAQPTKIASYRDLKRNLENGITYKCLEIFTLFFV